MLMRRGVMGLLLLRRGRRRLLLLLLGMMLLMVVVMGQVVVLAPLRRHAHRRRGPPLCELSLEACRLMRFALIGTLFSPTCFAGSSRRCRNRTRGTHGVSRGGISCIRDLAYTYLSVGEGSPSRVRIVRSTRLSAEKEGRVGEGRATSRARVLAITSRMASLLSSSFSRVRDGSSRQSLGSLPRISIFPVPRTRGRSPRSREILAACDYAQSLRPRAAKSTSIYRVVCVRSQPA